VPEEGFESTRLKTLGRYERADMCEAHAFILQKGKEEKIFENVDEVYVEGEEVKMISIFGEQKIVKARIKSYNNSQGKIVLEAL
jgi:predicted RNA-binding protein